MKKHILHPDSAESEGDLVELIKIRDRVERDARALRRTAWLSAAAGALLAAALLAGGLALRAGAGGPGLEAGAPGPTGAGAPGPTGAGAGAPVLVCYYNTPGDARALQPADVPPRLCSHINVAFARVRNKTVHLDPPQLDALREVVLLKRVNPDLKVLVSVGGAGGSGFPEMVADHASRKVFIRSIKSLLRNYTLDGIDLDWEFPTGPRQRQHFSQLLREIRTEYIREKRNYILTVAVVADEIMAEAAYDFDQLNLYTDFVNVMTYDYHFYTRMTPFTGFNSPLFAEPNQRLFLATLNVNYTMHMYLARGLAPDKLVVGIPTYGHSFRLVNPRNAAPGAPAAGPGALGSAGFVSYPEACRFARRPGARARDAAAAVPYARRGAEWLSYEDEDSAARKAALAARLRLRGAMLYSLGADDHTGACAARRFPLAAAVRRALGRA